jgi:hypothetical protein
LAPFFRASESPIAIACFLLLTFLPDLPLLSVPALRFFMARPTFFAAPLEYFRFFAFLAIASIPSSGWLGHPDWNSAYDQRFISSALLKRRHQPTAFLREILIYVIARTF